MLRRPIVSFFNNLTRHPYTPTRTYSRQPMFFTESNASDLVNPAIFRKRIIAFFAAFPPPTEVLAFFSTLRKDQSYHWEKKEDYPHWGDIARELKLNPDALQKSIIDLLLEPHQPVVITKRDFSLIPEQEEYCKAVPVLLNSPLSQRPYEPGKEAVDERTHALLCFELARKIGFSTYFQLVMLLHDSGRLTHEDEEYCHRKHHEEGHIITKPLFKYTAPPIKYSEQPIEYPLNHGFIKFLLTQFNRPIHQQIISGLSRKTLSIQKNDFSDLLNAFLKKEPYRLLCEVYLLLMFQAIDQFGKVPAHMLLNKKTQQPLTPEELYGKDDEWIFLMKEMFHNTNVMLKDNPIEQERHKEDLNDALKLIYRPRFMAEFVPSRACTP